MPEQTTDTTTSSTTQTPSAAPPSGDSSTKKAVGDAQGYDAQNSALVPDENKRITGGPALKKAQEQLNAAGFDVGKPDGIWGKKTEAAVVAFKKAKGMDPTPVIDGAMQAELEKTPPKVEPAAAEKKEEAAKTDAPTKPPADGQTATTPPEEEKKEEAPVSSTRQAIVAAARAEIGKVNASSLTGVDDEGKPARKGWDRLTEFHKIAFGGGFTDFDLLKRPRAGKKGVVNQETGEIEQKQVSDTLHSWCGIFAIYSVKTGGGSAGNWSVGNSAATLMKKATIPQPGDVVVTPANNHHAVIQWVEPGAAEKAAKGKTQDIKVRTIDGNTGAGEVAERPERPLSYWAWGAWSPE